jgi:hypothetical protein
MQPKAQPIVEIVINGRNPVKDALDAIGGSSHRNPKNPKIMVVLNRLKKREINPQFP